MGVKYSQHIRYLDGMNLAYELICRRNIDMDRLAVQVHLLVQLHGHLRGEAAYRGNPLCWLLVFVPDPY